MSDDDATIILVANADESVREVLARIVETAGLEAVRLDPTADVAQAVATSEAAGIVLDLGAANLAALQAIRAQSNEAAAAARVVVVGTGPAGGHLAWKAGADGFLVRPFHARDLQGALTEALALDGEAREARRVAADQALTS